MVRSSALRSGAFAPEVERTCERRSYGGSKRSSGVSWRTTLRISLLVTVARTPTRERAERRPVPAMLDTPRALLRPDSRSAWSHPSADAPAGRPEQQPVSLADVPRARDPDLRHDRSLPSVPRSSRNAGLDLRHRRGKRARRTMTAACHASRVEPSALKAFATALQQGRGAHRLIATSAPSRHSGLPGRRQVDVASTRTAMPDGPNAVDATAPTGGLG